jgi:hypothetical protein
MWMTACNGQESIYKNTLVAATTQQSNSMVGTQPVNGYAGVLLINNNTTNWMNSSINIP